MLVAKATGELPTALKLHFLGSCDSIEASCDDAAVARTVAEIEAVAKEMAAAAAVPDPIQGFETKPGPLCSWCSFKKDCPAFQ
jgi:putative RecB family exonuclease